MKEIYFLIRISQTGILDVNSFFRQQKLDLMCRFREFKSNIPKLTQ